MHDPWLVLSGAGAAAGVVLFVYLGRRWTRSAELLEAEEFEALEREREPARPGVPGVEAELDEIREDLGRRSDDHEERLRRLEERLEALERRVGREAEP